MRKEKGFIRLTFVLLTAFIFFGFIFGSDLKKADKLAKEGKFEEAVKLYEKVIDSKPSSDDARVSKLALADIYYENLKNQAKGLELYQSVALEFPKTDEANKAQYRLGVHYYKAEDYVKAKDLFSKLINDATLSEEAGNAQLLVAKIWEKEGNYQRAVFNYTGYAKLHPDSVQAVDALMMSAAISLEKLNKTDEAISAYQDVIKTYRDDPKAQAQVEAARKKLSDLGARIPDASSSGEASSEMLTPQQRRAARLDAKRERDAPRGQRGREISAAMGAAGQAALQPSSFGYNPDELMREMSIPADSQGTLYDAMAMVANMYFQEDDYAKAGTLYERAIQIGSKSAEVYRNLATCFRKMGLEGKAKETYQKAIAADPSIMDSLIDSGESRYSLGEYQEALTAYRSLLGISPGKDSRIYFDISLVYRKQYQEKQEALKSQSAGAENEAIKAELNDLVEKEIDALERSIAIKPGDTDALQNLAEALAYRKGNSKAAEVFDDAAKGKTNSFKVQKAIADLCYKHGSYNWSRVRYQAALRNVQSPTSNEKISPDEIAYVNAMVALSAAKDKRIADGKNELNAQIQENPKNDFAYYGLGEIAMLENNNELAIENFKKAIEINAGQHQANLTLGNLYLNTGRKSEAIKLWESYLTKNEKDEIVKTKLEAIRKE